MTDIKKVLDERLNTHGEYRDHAYRSQLIKEVYRKGRNWNRLSDIQKETLEMNAHKVARILEGNPNHKDHWDDIAGYATLVSDRLDQDSKSEQKSASVSVAGKAVTQPSTLRSTMVSNLAELFQPGSPEDGGHHDKPKPKEPAPAGEYLAED